MSTPPRKSSELDIYHVVLRGINKQRIFEDSEDYSKFLETLRKYQRLCGYKLFAYCLMSNHVHLLIRPGSQDLATIFRRIGPSFVQWYNIKYQRVGHLFQSRFRSRPINNASQLLIVIRYIHQNPVKAAICSTPAQYKYSSYRDYFDNNLIDAELIRSLVSEEYFFCFNCEESYDKCMDIDEEMPRVLSDEAAIGIMRELSGCGSVAEFQGLPADRRDEVLRGLKMAGVTLKQANRITGISYGVVKRAFAGED